MKAAAYDRTGGPDVIRYIDLPDPAPEKDDVLIQVEAISIEGGDLISRRSSSVPVSQHVVGYAAAGTVIAVGAHVTQRRIGDRVTTFGMDGSHASLRAVPAANTWLVPDRLGMEAAAALPISFGTAHHCLFARGTVSDGERVLIHAATGGVGAAAVQLAARAGACVLAVARGAERADQLREFGATYVIDRDRTDVREEVLRLTAGAGVELVIDPVGSTLTTSLAALAPEGRLVFVGNAGGKTLNLDLWPALQANQTLLGVFMGTQLARPAVHATIERLLGDAASGTLTVPVDRVFLLADAAAAHRHAESGSVLGRVVMRP